MGHCSWDLFVANMHHSRAQNLEKYSTLDGISMWLNPCGSKIKYWKLFVTIKITFMDTPLCVCVCACTNFWACFCVSVCRYCICVYVRVFFQAISFV